jgi:divalent metal cation (Fe/Co/Zn/Cd) transporter
MLDNHFIDLQEEREKVARSETLAIRLSNFANMVLFAAKVYASVRSGSLAIIASTLDSLLDLLSGFILWFTAFSMQTPNPYRYPIGKKRMQPLVSFYLCHNLYFQVSLDHSVFTIVHNFTRLVPLNF